MWLAVALWIINACQIHEDKDFQGQPQTFLDTSYIVDNLSTLGVTFSPVDLGLASRCIIIDGKSIVFCSLGTYENNDFPCQSQICLKTLPFFVYI
jgi:hypothetical protein